MLIPRTRLGRRSLLALLTTGAVAVAVGLALFQPWKLVVDDVVDEAPPPGLAEALAPTAAGTAGTAGSATGTGRPSGGTPTGGPTGGTRPGSTPGAVATAPAPQARLLARGTFLSHEHTTTGALRVVALPDGRRVLRIEGLDTSNGPDLRVWITDAPVLPGRAGWSVFDDGRYVELGRLKGNRGNQNYDLPAAVDLDRLRSISIWCDRFNVSFGAAELRRP